MKQEFAKGTLRDAKKKCPWAVKLAKVIDGYQCFESLQDFYVWKNQK